jgi:hypothetical protein
MNITESTNQDEREEKDHRVENKVIVKFDKTVHSSTSNVLETSASFFREVSRGDQKDSKRYIQIRV